MCSKPSQPVPFSLGHGKTVPRNNTFVVRVFLQQESLLATRMMLPPYWISMCTMLLFLFSALIFCTHYGHFGAHFEQQYMQITTTTKMHIVYGNFSIFFFNEWMENAS
jgi:hypothetical protein